VSNRESGTSDQRLRHAAGLIQQRHPSWLIMYGPYSRMIWAFPAFDVPRGTYFGDASPADLDTRMSQTEMTYLRGMP
jgi:hypothetical protein